jgi:YD repeat-containing protein
MRATRSSCREHLSRIISTSWAAGSGLTYVLDHVDGRRETLVPTETGVVTSVSNWKLTCDSATSMYRLYSPDGTIYTLGQKHYRVVDGHFAYEKDLRFVLQATQIADRNGNTLSIAYTAMGTTGFASNWTAQPVRLRTAYLPTSVTASDGRSLSFTYDPGAPAVNAHTEGYAARLQSINGPNGMVWRYNHAKHPNEVYDDLAEVIRPDGTSWRYTYDPPSSSTVGRLLHTVTYPTGGVRTHEYEATTPYAGCSINQEWDFVEGVRLKKVSTSDGGIWQYTYTLGASNGAYDVTTVSTPSGVEIYRHIGVGYFTPASLGTPDLVLPIDCTAWQPNPWLLGLLAEKEIGSNFKEVTEWDSRLHSSIWRHSVLARTGIREATVQTRAPVVKKKTVTLDGATYVKEYSAYDQYGNPTTITESGPNGGSRVTTQSYYVNNSKWILHQLQNESFAGSTTTRTFDGNGNLTGVTQDGVTRTFAYDAQGNVTTVTLPRNLVHTYSSHKRGIPQSESQPVGINLSRTVSDAGYVTSETDGEGRARSYSYDGLGRMMSIHYARGNNTSMSYTSVSKTVARGGLTEITEYDGFGRPMRNTLGGIATTFSYDSLSRQTFESNPGATAGTTYEYDVLNRIRKITNADATYKSHTYGAGSVTITDERSKVTTQHFRAYGDPANRFLTAVVAAEPSANMTIGRNSLDLVTSVSQGGVTRTFGYDTRNYLTSELSPENGTTTYERDAAGNMTARIIGGLRTDFAYDGQNRLMSVSYSDGTPAVTQAYSKTNKLKTVSSSVATRSMGYDANDNLTSESLSVGAVQLAAQYSYTNNDQLSTITNVPRSPSSAARATSSIAPTATCSWSTRPLRRRNSSNTFIWAASVLPNVCRIRAR